MTVNLSGVSNGQEVDLAVNAADDLGQTFETPAGIAIKMVVLLGDITAEGSVNSSDISQAKSLSGFAVSTTNFRADVTVSGDINSSDIALVKSKSGTGRP